MVSMLNLNLLFGFLCTLSEMMVSVVDSYIQTTYLRNWMITFERPI